MRKWRAQSPVSLAEIEESSNIYSKSPAFHYEAYNPVLLHNHHRSFSLQQPVQSELYSFLLFASSNVTVLTISVWGPTAMAALTAC